MPFLRLLEFAAKDLTISYRASHEPQTLDIVVEARHRTSMGLGPIAMRPVIEGAAYGAASGAEFNPSMSRMTKIKGPDFNTPEAHGPCFAWSIEVVAVSPLYMRSIVEHLRGIGGMGGGIVRMLVRGSLSLDDSPLSVRERDLKLWLDDCVVYPGRWRPLPYRFRRKRAKRGAMLRIALEGTTTPAVYEAFEMVATVWGTSLTDYADEARRDMGMMQIFPTLHRTEAELSARWSEFTHIRTPAADLMANMLTRFHDNVARIREAELSLA